ncbi:MAG: DUF4922 domain-containing protein [Muribaculaceae bacterium]|nr:DUF4922 domain-containing protein [Muribaculaceae bacterium]
MQVKIDTPAVERFIDSQLAEWQLAAKNFAALDGVKVKTLDVDGMPIKVQFNPARIVSSGAKVDAKAVAARPCFLCAANRPSEQSGLDWHERYTVLVNPFPIFPRHLTVPDTSHVDQRIAGRMADMLSLAADLPGYTVFYNGPRCGASAPDHMHFQAGNSDFLTLGDFVAAAELRTVKESDGARLSVADSLPLKFFVIDAAKPESGAAMFERLLRAMPVQEGDAEPMMNILAYATADGTRAVVVPRKRHRPSFYGDGSGDTMMISPASVDMGGVFITPLEKDFERLDAALVKKIFDELCLSKNEINEIASDVK